MDPEQLADFLRSRRVALTPADAGLPPGKRRRTPGLRREEVAALSSISTDYYSRLEQSRSPQPSLEVVGALSRALQLTPDEADHLFRLAGHNAPARMIGGEQVNPAMVRILDRLQDTPAQVTSALGETLLQTPPARALMGDRTAYRGFDRSVVYRWFTHEEARQWDPPEDHAEISRRFVAGARLVYAREGPGSRAAQIVEQLLARSAEFTALWKRHDVASINQYAKRIIHPSLGLVEMQCHVLHDPTTFQTLTVFTAEPDSPSYAKLEALCADPALQR